MRRPRRRYQGQERYPQCLMLDALPLRPSTVSPNHAVRSWRSRIPAFASCGGITAEELQQLSTSHENVNYNSIAGACPGPNEARTTEQGKLNSLVEVLDLAKKKKPEDQLSIVKRFFNYLDRIGEEKERKERESKEITDNVIQQHVERKGQVLRRIGSIEKEFERHQRPGRTDCLLHRCETCRSLTADREVLRDELGI